MRRGGRRPVRLLSALLLAGAVVVGCSQSAAELQADGTAHGNIAGDGTNTPAEQRTANVPLATASPRQSGGVVAAGAADAVYNYGPTVMTENGRTRIWWCSQYGSAPPPGDDILYGEASSANGPFTGPGGGAPPAVLSGSPGHFDGVHTCDPSVLRVGGTYFMYYTGAAGDHALGNAVGMATSTDGVHWTRANGGQPILGPSHDVHRANVYGAGQPAAVFLDGWYYLMFTDTTGRAAGWNGAGQFVLRAHDAAFRSGVEALGVKGFASVSGTAAPRERSVVDAFSADLAWVGALDAFAVAHETAEGTTITFWDRDFTVQPYAPVVLPGAWQEGPGLIRRPDGHAPTSPADPCGTVPLDVVRATRIGDAGAPTGLMHFGLDVRGAGGCSSPSRLTTTFDGVAMPSPDRMIDLFRRGERIRVDRRSVAGVLAGELLDRPVPQLAKLPVKTRLHSGATVVHAYGRGYGIVLDGVLYGLPDTSIVPLNGSGVLETDPRQWDASARGLPLGG
ncbi:glycoside hydrolase family protein [Amycolatopsis sulphurea]|uniref:beta-xylosidase n=1 Tax=Amycolatopsis sulphurea TaxID=76022 RepID=UPI001475393B|nr:beta-xylosidase [Amycolatopsis sulphurea]